MSQQTHRTANGKMVAMEQLRLENEKTIAVGNTKTNARGDLLGPGGQPIATKQETVNEYYNLHTQVAGGAGQTNVSHQSAAPVADPVIEEHDNIFDSLPPTPLPPTPPKLPHSIEAPAGTKPIRGSLAAAVSGTQKVVKQEIMKTAKQQVKAKGPQRF